MNDTIRTILDDGCKLLKRLHKYDIQILEISIYHSTSVLFKIVDMESEKTFFVSCAYCMFYKGDTNIWTNAKLELNFITDYILLDKRNIKNEFFKLEDINNSFCIKFKNLKFSDSLDININTISSTIESDINVEGIKLDYVKHKLKEWGSSRVIIINSDKNLIQLRFERGPLIYYDFINPDNNPINISSEDKYLDIFCSNINFLQVDFDDGRTDTYYKVTYKDDVTRIYSDNGKFDLIFSHITKVTIS